MSRHWRLCSLLLCALAAAGAQASAIQLRLDAREVIRKRVHTEETLPVKAGPLSLVYPKWIPGEHAPSGPIESIIGLTISAHGTPLAWARDPKDMFVLHLTVPRGVAQLQISIDSGLAIDGGGFTGAPTSSSQLAVLPWNEFLLIPQGVDADSLPVSASVLAPPDWHLVCALTAQRAPDGAWAFEDSTVMRLIDSPVQMGLHARLLALKGSEPRPELPHQLSIMADSEAALTGAEDLSAGYSRLVAENGALFGTRPYRHYTWLLSLSDHVAHFGLEHHESSDNRLNLDALEGAGSRMELAWLLGHEYVHTWNGKYRRPAGLLSPDYDAPMDTTLLWSYEGLTEFWGTMLPTRAGLISPEYCRDLLAEAAGDFVLRPGARWRPMLDTAVDAQQLYYAPSAWQGSRRSVDFYDASVFLWLDVDAELRARSQGKASLDDYVRRFYSGASGAPQLKPYVEQEIYDTLTALEPGDWRKLIHRHLDDTGTAALTGALERHGWTVAYSTQMNLAIEASQKYRKSTQRRWSIGFDLDKDANVIDVIEDRAAARAGASPGMTVIAVNGQKYSTAVLDAAISAAASSHQPIALLVESDDYYRSLSVAYFDGPRFPHLERIEGRPDTLGDVIEARVK
jgi:predicted metalloprotease with PDZ domain